MASDPSVSSSKLWASSVARALTGPSILRSGGQRLPFISKIRRILPFLSLAVFAVVLYDAWIFYSRHERAREADQQRAEKEAADARRTLDLIGQLKILNLYAVPAIIQRGKSARLCYSVVGAKTVHMQPEIPGVWPALSRCVEISPRRDTLYTLTAEDDAGHSVSEKVIVQVQQGAHK
jgi:hypothetical protein